MSKKSIDAYIRTDCKCPSPKKPNPDKPAPKCRFCGGIKWFYRRLKAGENLKTPRGKMKVDRVSRNRLAVLCIDPAGAIRRVPIVAKTDHPLTTYVPAVDYGVWAPERT